MNPLIARGTVISKNWLVVMLFISFPILAEEVPDAADAGWQGHKTCERLHEDKAIKVLRCTFAPGIGHERHSHAPHYLYVINGGKLRVTDQNGTSETEVVTGSFRQNAAIPWHEAMNIGQTTLQYLIVVPK